MARVELKPGAMDRLTEDMAVAYHRDVAPKVLLLMRFEAPIDTGQLRESGMIDPIIHRDAQSRVIRFRFPVKHAQINFAGRGVVVPVRAKALRWVTKTGVVVFAQRSKAVPPNRWPNRVFERLGYRNVVVRKR